MWNFASQKLKQIKKKNFWNPAWRKVSISRTSLILERTSEGRLDSSGTLFRKFTLNRRGILGLGFDFADFFSWIWLRISFSGFDCGFLSLHLIGDFFSWIWLRIYCSGFDCGFLFLDLVTCSRSLVSALFRNEHSIAIHCLKKFQAVPWCLKTESSMWRFV